MHRVPYIRSQVGQRDRVRLVRKIRSPQRPNVPKNFSWLGHESIIGLCHLPPGTSRPRPEATTEEVLSEAEHALQVEVEHQSLFVCQRRYLRIVSGALFRRRRRRRWRRRRRRVTDDGLQLVIRVLDDVTGSKTIDFHEFQWDSGYFF